MRGGRFLRTLLLLLAIVSFVAVATAAASPLHWHSREIGGACQICTVGHLPVVQPPVSAHLYPPSLATWHVAAAGECRAAACCHREVSSRGPPV